MKQLSLLYLLKDDQILLALKKRGLGSGLYNGVGGKQIGQESIEQTAARECQEEVKVTPIDLKKVAEFIFSDVSGTSLVSVFVCTDWVGQPEETEEMRPYWFKLQELPYDQMWPDDRYWLPLVLSGERLTGKFVFNDNNEITYWQLAAAGDQL